MSRLIRRVALVALLLCGVAAQAEHTHFWKQSRFNEFTRGTADGVAIRSDGLLYLAPHMTVYADPGITYLWALRVDSKGRLYAAGGSNARVIRFDSATKMTTVFESQELSAQDILLERHDDLYVATSPDGKVYQVTPQGQRTVFFDPKTKYIWAMAMDAQGNLFVGTGDDGKVFVIAPNGESSLFYHTEEQHVRVLAFDAKGNLILGTDPDGLILRVEVRRASGKAPAAGSAYVLFETGQREVSALAISSSGNIYAAASGEKLLVPGAAAEPEQPSLGISALTKKAGGAVVVSSSHSGAQAFSPVLNTGSKIFRIAPDGTPLQIWGSSDQSIHSLALTAGGKLLAGTGNEGKILEISDDGIYSVLANGYSSQVTGLLTGPGGETYVAGANPGKVFALGPQQVPAGTFTSQVFDASIFSRWGRITWWGDGNANANVRFYVRTGNTSNTNHNWSNWAGPYTNPQGQEVSCPPARFAQWKAVFMPSAGAEKPTISWVRLAYQPQNLAPVMDDIVLQKPGIRVQGPIVPANAGTALPVPLRYPQTHESAGPIISMQAGQFRAEIPPQGVRERGYRSVLWSAHDDNDDDLIYSIYYRPEGDSSWMLLKSKLKHEYFSWDTTAMPDGAYYLKIVVSDSPSNPPEDALQADRISDRFLIVNTPPVIEQLAAKTGGNSATITFTAKASSCVLDRAEYSLDAGDWELLFPESGLTDSSVENYSRVFPGLKPGEHSVGVRVFDQYDNSVTSQIRFTIAAAGKN